jgi:hypothetical protein
MVILMAAMMDNLHRSLIEGFADRMAAKPHEDGNHNSLSDNYDGAHIKDPLFVVPLLNTMVAMRTIITIVSLSKQPRNRCQRIDLEGHKVCWCRCAI